MVQNKEGETNYEENLFENPKTWQPEIMESFIRTVEGYWTIDLKSLWIFQ